MYGSFSSHKTQFLTWVLLGSMAFSSLPGWATEANPVISGDVRVTVFPTPIEKAVSLPGSQKTVNMAFRSVPVADALRALGKQGGFNVAVDDTVSEKVSVDLYHVKIQDALETLKTYGNLAYAVQGNTLMATSATSEQGQRFQRSLSRIIPLKYANAKVIAGLLNSTVLKKTETEKDASPSQEKVVPDSHTNSLVVVGTPSDLKTVQEYVDALDTPREMKTWRLSHANALDVATQLASSVFNDGTALITLSNGSGSGGAGSTSSSTNTVNGLAVESSTIRVQAENLVDGRRSNGGSGGSSGGGSASGGQGSGGDSSGGSSSATSGSSGSSGSAGGGGTNNGASLNTSLTLRAMVKQQQTLQVSPQGPIILPDTRLNSITLLGTAEQIALAESMIPTMDRKVPQVVIEAALVELTETAQKELGYNTGGSDRKISFGSNNTQSGAPGINNAFSRAAGLATSLTNPTQNLFQFSTRPIVKASEFLFQLNALVSQNKAKLLGHPTIMTTHDNEGIISIVDEIVKTVTVTLATGSSNALNNFSTTTSNIGEAGIILNILPKIGADHTISMRVRPTVSSVRATTTDRFGNLVTLLSKRQVETQQVSLKDGESFVLGGLIQDRDTHTVSRLPLLSELPIVGAMARNSARSKSKTELIVVITPHIVPDETTAQNGEAIQPASLQSKVPTEPGKMLKQWVSRQPSAIPGKSQVAGGAAPILPLVKVESNQPKVAAPSKPRPLLPAVGEKLTVPAERPVLQLKGAPKSERPSPTVQVSSAPKSLAPEENLDISDEAIRKIMKRFR